MAMDEDQRGWPRWKRALMCVALVVLAVGLWRAAAWARTHSIRRLAGEVSRIGVFGGTPLPNSRGQQVLFAETTDAGLALFSGDTQTGRKLLVREVAESRLHRGVLNVLGWSPDDSLFAYNQPGKARSEDIVICSGLVAEKIFTLYTSNELAGFAWLSPISFAYVDGRQDLHVVGRADYGQWKETARHPKIGAATLTAVTALSSNRVAWKEGRAIKTLDLDSGERRKIWESPGGMAMNFTYSPERNTLLISSSRGSTFRLHKVFLGVPAFTNLVYETTERVLVRPQHINRGRGYAIICDDPTGRSLLVSPTGGEPATNLFAGGNVATFMAAANKLYLRASTNMEPAGIWEYTVDTGALRRVFSAGGQELDAGNRLTHSAGVIVKGEREIRYHLWMPRRGFTGGKHPLVLGQTPYGWTPYPHTAAAAGCCWATVNRPTWEIGLETWVEDVLALYAELKSNPRIDFSRVYLYGRSAETVPLSELAAQEPGRWRGAIMFSPTVHPDLRQCSLHTLLLDCGEHDGLTRDRLRTYQTEAAVRHGVPVTVFSHETARHTSFSRVTAANRVRELGSYLLHQ